MLLLIVTFWLKFDGEPLMDFKAMAHLGMAWEPYVMFALILPFTTIFTSAETGISQFIVTALSPIFGRQADDPLYFAFHPDPDHPHQYRQQYGRGHRFPADPLIHRRQSGRQY